MEGGWWIKKGTEIPASPPSDFKMFLIVLPLTMSIIDQVQRPNDL